MKSNEIVKKFDIDKYDRKLIINIPADVSDFKGLLFNDVFDGDRYNMIFAFIFSLDEFVHLLETVIEKNLLEKTGMLCFAYPKRENKKYKESIGRDDFFRAVKMDSDGYVNNSTIKFNKLLAFNKVFTVIGFKNEPKRKNKLDQPSQRVEDYVERIPEIKKHFEENTESLDLFVNLTPGYQREWARHVFGVKNLTTTNKRLKEMENVLKQGYKSMDAYRRRIKIDEIVSPAEEVVSQTEEGGQSEAVGQQVKH